MPTWGEMLGEVQRSAAAHGGRPDYDSIRRRYLADLQALTGRETIVYYTDWLGGGQPNTSIVLEDMQGLMETCRGLSGPNLDLILHSPGGSPDATASLVRYLRGKFNHIRTFVPLAAMSAATMWALASDEISMGKHSQLGPIDPQIVTADGQYPARGILEQFERAATECAQDPRRLPAWLPILQQYGPSLLDQCARAQQLATRLVRVWLRSWMLAGQPNAVARSRAIAEYFASYRRHQSHGIGIGREEARARGVVIVDLESDQRLQDAVLSVHHAVLHTLAGTLAVKIIENHMGRAFIKINQPVTISAIPQPSPTTPNPPVTQP